MEEDRVGSVFAAVVVDGPGKGAVLGRRGRLEARAELRWAGRWTEGSWWWGGAVDHG